MWYYPLSGLINGLSLTILGIFVFLRNRKALPNITYAIFCFFISFWSYSYFLWQISKTSKDAFFWCQMLMVGATFIPASYFHFIITLIGKYHDKNTRKVIYLAYLLAGIFTILNFTPFMIKDVRPRLAFPFWPTAGSAYKYFLIYFAVYAIYGCYLLLREAKHASGIKRNQFIYIFIGSLIGYLGGSTNFPLWYDIKLYPVGNILSSIYVGLIGYVIVRYRLMDIKIAVTRAGIFAVVYTLVLGLPFWLGYTTKSWFFSTALAVLLATLGPFIYQYLRRRAEDVLLRDQRRYHATLRELSKTMTRIRDLDQLLKAIVLTVFDTVKVSFAAIYLKDEEYKSYRLKHYFPKKEQSRFQESIPLDYPLIKLLNQQKRPLLSEEAGPQDKVSLDSGLVIPCFMEDDLLGFMVLGAKPNNQMYTPDDLIVFETLSYSTGLAIENCIFWKEIEDRQRKARLQEMDTYSYSLAHEIDNPMQTVIGQAGLLQKYLLKELNLTEEKRQDLSSSLDFILEAARRVSGMVKAIREFGQKTTGEPKPLKIDDVVESFAKLYYPQFKAKTVLFEKISNLKNPVFVLGEKPELMQVLVIIANNSLHAMTYSKEKKITLTIEQPNPDWVNIIFTDTGHGINKELLPIIFSPFTTTKASTEGTGMGLYNAKKIIDRYKGKIWAQSEGPDKGATFIIELPIAKDIKPEELRLESRGKRLF